MNETIIVKAPNYDKAFLQSIKETVRIFKEFIVRHDPDKPTCNQELYVRDVEFLLYLLATKRESYG
jgi:hypothetical protein